MMTYQVGQVRKAVAATLAAVATWGATAGADGTYTQQEWWGLLGVLVAAVSTFAIPNDPPPDTSI